MGIVETLIIPTAVGLAMLAAKGIHWIAVHIAR